MGICLRRPSSANEVGQKATEDGPVDHGPIGIAGDIAGAAPAADEPVVEIAHPRPGHDADDDFKHFFSVGPFKRYLLWQRVRILSNFIAIRLS